MDALIGLVLAMFGLVVWFHVVVLVVILCFAAAVGILYVIPLPFRWFTNKQQDTVDYVALMEKLNEKDSY